MPSNKEFLDFILEQLSQLSDIKYRKMMGEYIIYYRGKVVGGIYDNRFLIKPTKSVLEIIPDAVMEIPYPNAKPMVLIEDIENQKLLVQLFNQIYSELPK
ncbi:MAG: TfoX/Sxy family protein [bacterium]|nr:TfoX/Sxy family protein [bacterium]